MDTVRKVGRPKIAPIEFTCQFDGKIFTMKPSYVTAYRKMHGRDPMYCSRKCMGQHKHREARRRNVFTCIQCGTTQERIRYVRGDGQIKYYSRQKLCSVICKDAWIKAEAGHRFLAGEIGRHVKRGGYVWLSIPAAVSRTGKKMEMLEHRHVMEQHVGRPLTKDETVHHINGVRDQNGIENLELFSSRHGPGQRVTDKVSFAIDMLLTYPEFAARQGYALTKIES